MSITKLCSNSTNKIINYIDEGVQTENLWSNDTSSDTQGDACESDGSLIDLSSSFDDSEYMEIPLNLVKVEQSSLSEKSCELLNNNTEEICKTFCETYKEFFKDVYENTNSIKQNASITTVIKTDISAENDQSQVTKNKNSSIHKTSIQDNFAKKNIEPENRVSLDSKNHGLVSFSNEHHQHQKIDLLDEISQNIDDKTICIGNEFWSHLDTQNCKVNVPQQEIYNDKLQLTDTVQDNHNSDDISCNVKELYNPDNLNYSQCEINEGQEKYSKIVQNPKSLTKGIINVQLSVRTGVNILNDNRTTAQNLLITEINYKNIKETLSDKRKPKESSLEKSFDSKFEASVRLKRLEERIQNYTLNKISPNQVNEKAYTIREENKEIQKSVNIQLDSPDLYIENVQKFDENAIHTSSQSRVDSCIDFLNISEKGEISSTPEISIANSLLNVTQTSKSSNSPLDKSISCNNELKYNETNFKKESKSENNKNIINSLSQINEELTDFDENHFFPHTYDSSEEKHNEDNETVFQTKQQSTNVLEDSPSDSEICRIFCDNKETVDSNSSKKRETPHRILKILEPESNYKTRPSTAELTTPDYTHCEFSAGNFAIFNNLLNCSLFECYDELTEEFLESSLKSKTKDIEKENLNCENSCECSLEAIPLYNRVFTMRETPMGPIRGLLKKPNRPPASRKNRVVFDETKNQFFDADYIILIREDCLYDDEEDTEPCTCGEHELVRICCDEGCCGYTDDGRTPPSPKFAPPIEFVDQATLSPPEGYKDAGGNLIDSALQGALGGHVFGAQHIQQLQVIQRLQQQRAAMLAAKAAVQANQQSSQSVCVECAECSECAAKQYQEEIGSQCSDESSPPCELPIALGTLVPVTKASPEKRIIQKEIVAGEERPRVLSPKLTQDNLEGKGMENIRSKPPIESYVLETITMTTITERRITHEAADLEPNQKSDLQTSIQSNKDIEANDSDESSTSKLNVGSINGILKGGKLRKGDQIQFDDALNTTSDDESSSKRSVRFTEETREREAGEGESQSEIDYRHPLDYVSHTMKRHSSIFHNALRPNSALRQLFPTTIHSSVNPNSSNDDTLKSLEESVALGLCDGMLSDSDTETIKKTIERNVLRRSLIKYEPKKRMPTKEVTSLEERIRQLTCDIDDPEESDNFSKSKNDYFVSKDNSSERRDSPTGEETPFQSKHGEKSFSPNSSASSSLSSSVGSTYKKITDLFNREKRQDRISENEEASTGIVPQDCRCPAGPDLGLGVQIQGGHTQIHQPPPPPPRHPDTRRQFLSTLVPLTACVAGQRDDLSYYTLAQPGNRNSITSSQCTDYSVGDIDKVLIDEDSKKVAPDVIAGTPGQETDELAAFAQQESNRTEKLKKRYSTENANSNPGSDDDDEQNDYGFNKRPQVKGIKSKYSTNDILQEMQTQLAQNAVPQPQKAQATLQTQTAQSQVVHSSTLPRPHTTMHIAAKQITAHHQHTASWSYYPEQAAPNNNVQQDAHNNYYHLPANARHSYHGHEAVAMQQTITHQPHSQYGKFARSPTRRPESPPPLRNYHQTMVLIPYNSNPYQQFASTESESTFGRQHNVVEYQQVTQQTIRVPVGYALPGMQLHVVAPTSHYTSTLPRINNGPKNAQFPNDQSNPKFNDRGVVRSEPEGAACVQANDIALSPTNNQSQGTNINTQNTAGHQKPQSNSVFYAMNV